MSRPAADWSTRTASPTSSSPPTDPWRRRRARTCWARGPWTSRCPTLTLACPQPTLTLVTLQQETPHLDQNLTQGNRLRNQRFYPLQPNLIADVIKLNSEISSPRAEAKEKPMRSTLRTVGASPRATPVLRPATWPAWRATPGPTPPPSTCSRRPTLLQPTLQPLHTNSIRGWTTGESSSISWQVVLTVCFCNWNETLTLLTLTTSIRTDNNTIFYVLFRYLATATDYFAAAGYRTALAGTYYPAADYHAALGNGYLDVGSPGSRLPLTSYDQVWRDGDIISGHWRSLFPEAVWCWQAVQQQRGGRLHVRPEAVCGHCLEAGHPRQQTR